MSEHQPGYGGRTWCQAADCARKGECPNFASGLVRSEAKRLHLPLAVWLEGFLPGCFEQGEAQNADA